MRTKLERDLDWRPLIERLHARMDISRTNRTGVYLSRALYFCPNDRKPLLHIEAPSFVSIATCCRINECLDETGIRVLFRGAGSKGCQSVFASALRWISVEDQNGVCGRTAFLLAFYRFRIVSFGSAVRST